MKNSSLFFLIFLFLNIVTPINVAAASSDTLRYGESTRPDTFDPYTSKEMSSLRLSELLFNGLIAVNEKQQIVADLAERWEINKKNKEFTFYLRDNVYWHNKSPKKYPFTAEDVQFTVNLISHKKSTSTQKHLFSKIKDVKVLDKQRVVIRLNDNANVGLAFFQFKILPKHVLKKSRYLTKRNPFVNKPIGTGPYKFLKSNHNREVSLVANSTYHNGVPKIKRIVAKPFADDNIMNQALNFDALDMIINVNPRNIAELQANPKFELASYNTLSYSYFAYNNKNSHLNNPKVRKAISHAINRQEMLQAFFNGQGRIISGPYAPGSWAYNLDVRPDKFDPDKSIRLLKDAGYKRTKSGFTDNSGRLLTFNLKVAINKNDESTKRVVLAYKNYLSKVGLKVNVNFMEREAWKRTVFQRHKFDISFSSWSFDDASDISSLFHSQYQEPWQNNFIQYSNTKVDELIDLLQNSQDFEEKRTISHQLHKILAEESPYTFLWSLSNYAAYNKKLKDVTIHPHRFFGNIQQWSKQ